MGGYSDNGGDWDAVVVGSGATGGVAAKTLTGLGLRVLILEAGGEVEAPPRGTLRSLARGARHLATRLRTGRQRVQACHPTYWTMDPEVFVDDVDNPYATPADAPFRWIRCRVVGGRTHAWDGVTPRMSDHELRAAERDGVGPLWPIRHADLAPHYARLERYLGVCGDRDGLPQLPDGSFVGPGSLNEAEKALADRAAIDLPERPVIASRGLPALRGAPEEDDEGSARVPLSNVRTTLRDALRSGRARLRPHSIVSRVLLDRSGKAARGVEFVDARSGATHRATGRLVFLCASSIESVRLLLNSASAAAGHPHGIGADSGVLGRYLMDHIAGNLFFQMPDLLPSRGQRALRGNEAFMVPRYQNLDERAAPHLRGFGMWGAVDRTWLPSVARTYPDECFGFLSVRGEVLPRHDNRVELDPSRRDRWGIPVARVQLRWGDNDLALANTARRHAVELIEAAGGEVAKLSHWLSAPLTKGPIATFQREWRCSTPGLFVHELGGARMGDSPADSVVDPYCAVWSVPNLYVTDGACWPTSGWQNPTLTQMALTDRAARSAVGGAPGS